MTHAAPVKLLGDRCSGIFRHVDKEGSCLANLLEAVLSLASKGKLNAEIGGALVDVAVDFNAAELFEKSLRYLPGEGGAIRRV